MRLPHRSASPNLVAQAESNSCAERFRMRLGEPPAALDEGLNQSPVAFARHALPAGTHLDRYEIAEILGQGTVGILYAATDRALAVPAVIAEYIPAALGLRDEDAQVRPRTAAHADAFAKGLKAFTKETRTLIRCDHPSLVRVLHQCEANSTAYRVMPRYPPRRLLEVRQTLNAPPDEDAVRALLDALLGALHAFHHAGGYHGKVIPSNILLLADDRPLLLGPGATGRAIAGDRIDALIGSAEPCFAPIEQIVESDIALHPSVDIYALAGVARYWMSGELPPPAFGAPGTARREKLADTVQRLRLTWPRLDYGASLLDALDSALSIYPAERPQSVAQMRARLGPARSTACGPASATRIAVPISNKAAPSSPVPAPQPVAPANATQDLDAIPLAPDAAPLTNSGAAPITDNPSVRTALKHQGPKRRRIAIWSGAVLVLLALLPIGMLELYQEREVGRVPDVADISRPTGGGSGAGVSVSAVDTAAPVTPLIAADAGAAKSVLTETAESPASPTNPPAIAQPSAHTPAPTRVVQQPASHAVPATPATPREVCGTRTQFSLYRCMQAQCSQPRWALHAQCKRLRTTDSVD